MSLKDYTELKGLTDRIHKTIVGGRLPHAYMLEGDRCIDKLAFAKDFAKAVLCREDYGWGCDSCAVCRKIEHGNYEDIFYVEADGLSVKDAEIEALQEKLAYAPLEGDRNIAIVSDADTMTIRAQNRFLKTLEEPAVGTLIMLLCDNADNMLPTVKSRCTVLRLGNYNAKSDTEAMNQAEELLDMAVENAYFHDIKECLTRRIKDRNEALALLDGFERVLSDYLRDSSYKKVGRDQIVKYIGLVEEARRDIKTNVNYRYVLRNLMLKIGG